MSKLTEFKTHPNFTKFPIRAGPPEKGKFEPNIDSIFSKTCRGEQISHYMKVGKYLSILRKREDLSGLKHLTTFQYVHVCNLIGLVLEQYDSKYNQTTFFETCNTMSD